VGAAQLKHPTEMRAKINHCRVLEVISLSRVFPLHEWRRNVANPRNTETLASLRAALEGQSSFYVVDYQGLPSNQIVALRKELRGIGARVLVAKNTLIHKAVSERGFEMRDVFHGPSALVLVGEDAVTPVKKLSEFAKKNDKGIPQAKGGILDGEVLDAKKLEMLSNMPSKDELRAQVVGVLSSKLSEFVGILEAKVAKEEEAA
jgi:large subunit ribosomal protein L10